MRIPSNLPPEKIGKFFQTLNKFTEFLDPLDVEETSYVIYIIKDFLAYQEQLKATKPDAN